MITIESIRTTRDRHISKNPHTWERIPVTFITIKKYDMSAPIDKNMILFHDSDWDCRPREILEEVIVKHGDNGQAITDKLCKKYGLDKHRYTNNAVV